MIEIATVDEWYELTASYPEFRHVSHTNLKDWGYMKAVSYIDQKLDRESHAGVRILEFGHAFNPYLLSRYQNRCEVWGADRAQGLTYFNDADWEPRFQKEVAPSCGNVRFVRTLVGETIPGQELPEDYFDFIVSISVMEEMPVADAGRIVAAASRLLRKGGALIGTYDLFLSNFNTITTEYYYEHRKAGLEIGLPPPGLFDWNSVLIENPLVVMLWYQHAQPEEGRKYWGHCGSIFTVGTKATT